MYFKTSKGLVEIQSRTYKLPTHLRRLLIMVDGHSTAAEMIDRLTTFGDVKPNLVELEAGGFIARHRSSPVAPGAASAPAPPEFKLDEAKHSIRSILLSAMGPAADYRIECIEAVTTPEQLRVELDTLRDLLPKVLSRQQAEQAWRQMEPMMFALERGSSSAAPLDRVAALPAQPAFNLNEAKSFTERILLGTIGPAAISRVERIAATTTPEQLRLELDAIRDMLPKVLSRRQAEHAWRQLEPIMASLNVPPL
ncbi:MAG: hypothetical protein WAV07_12255 [Candidatus Contendobacter sp.]